MTERQNTQPMPITLELLAREQFLLSRAGEKPI